MSRRWRYAGGPKVVDDYWSPSQPVSPAQRKVAMPVVNIEWHEGRTIAQKKLLAEGITAEFVKIGTPAEKVTIIFRDVQKHDWACAGKLAAESSIRKL